jgi:hypothetical protein
MSSSNLLDLRASRETILMATISSKIWTSYTCYSVVTAINSCEITLAYQIAIVIDIIFDLLPGLSGRRVKALFGGVVHHFSNLDGKF